MLYFDSSLGTNHEFGYSLGTSLGTSESLDITCFYTNIYICTKKTKNYFVLYIYSKVSVLSIFLSFLYKYIYNCRKIDF